jgi:hypothetical protein
MLFEKRNEKKEEKMKEMKKNEGGSDDQGVDVERSLNLARFSQIGPRDQSRSHLRSE